MSLVDNDDLGSVPICLKRLQPLLNESKYSEASKLCHKCLKKWPGENAFYRVKAFCEIQLSRWHSCLQTIGWLHGYRTHPAVSDKPRKRRSYSTKNTVTNEQYPNLTPEGHEALETIREAAKVHFNNDNCLWLHFEQSYCYYKLGKYNLGLKALSMCRENLQPVDLIKTQSQEHYSIDSQPFQDTKSTLLKAQLCLRLGHFKEASDIYKPLKLKGAESLLPINRLSVDLSLASDLDKGEKRLFLEKIVKKIDEHFDKGKSDDPYELYFNYACALALSGDVLKAQDYLDLSNEMLENELKQEDGDDDPEDQVEFANIMAFRAYLNHKRGNHELAKTINSNLLSTFLNSTDVDQATVLVSLNNQLFLGADPEEVPNLVHKIENLMKKEQITRKFSDSELNMIHGNCVWSFLSTGKLKECQKYLESFHRFLKPQDFFFFKSALMCVDGKVSKGVSLLRQAISSSKDLRFVECLIKLLIRESKYKDALDLLQEHYILFEKDMEQLKKYFLLLVRVYICLNSPEKVKEALEEYARFSQSSGGDEALKVGCKYLESKGMHKEVAEIYNVLYLKDKNDKLAQVGVVYNQSFTNDIQMEVPEDYAGSLVREVRFIDAEELEAEYKVTYDLSDEKKDGRSKVRKRKNKKRRNKRPKEMTGNPDPERWFHKHERTAYKKQARRRRDATKGNTQGSTSAFSSKPTTGTITATSSSTKRGKKKKR